MPPNTLSRESTLDSAIRLLDALNQTTRGRGTLRLHLPEGARTKAPSGSSNQVWQGFSYDYATSQEAEQGNNVLQAVYSAHAERHTGRERLDAELYDSVLVVWVHAASEEALRGLVDALVHRLRSFE